MLPVTTEDIDLSPPDDAFWKLVRNLAISALVVCALALITSFLVATSAQAQTAAAKGELRIGYQKSASLFVLQKADTFFELKLIPKAIKISGAIVLPRP